MPRGGRGEGIRDNLVILSISQLSIQAFKSSQSKQPEFVSHRARYNRFAIFDVDDDCWKERENDHKRKTVKFFIKSK